MKSFISTKKSTRSLFYFWKSNSSSNSDSKNKKKKQLTTNTNSISFFNATFNIQIKDVFGFGILAETFLSIIDLNYKFLEKQNNKYLKWGIILWEILLITILIWYLGKIVDLIIIMVKFIDDGIRGAFKVVIVIFSLVFSGLKRIIGFG
ncbi:hypothetical protein Glove_460g3 [Diversispora epigaea]|uniref:Uncharacterized protein n=1 Tax=Diversispora epigaea TaxID=1348612 RepID=A0A397GSE1_9GLOM|nr:hypothetical protein Glove_460g3 [Diversispora epigaea]